MTCEDGQIKKTAQETMPPIRLATKRKVNVELKGQLARDNMKKPPAANNPHRPRIWVLVANERRAQIFGKNEGHLQLMGSVEPGSAEATAQSFAQKLAEWLEHAAKEDGFDRLVVAAPPAMLMELRQAFSRPVYTRIVAEASKDLTTLGELALRQEVSDMLWF